MVSEERSHPFRAAFIFAMVAQSVCTCVFVCTCMHAPRLQIRIPPQWLDNSPSTGSNRIVRGTGHRGDWFSYEGHHMDL